MNEPFEGTGNLKALVQKVREDQSILIVDDDDRVRWTLERQLKNLRVTLHFASSGEDAQALLDTHPISVMVTDQRMPGMSGTALLSWVKDQYPDVVRVMITANVEMETALGAINTGEVFRFVPKPWSQDDIRNAVTSALEHHLRAAERGVFLAELDKTNHTLRNMNDHLLELVEERTSQIRAQAENLAVANEELRESFNATLEVLSTIMGFADSRIMDHSKRTVSRLRGFALRAGVTHEWLEPLVQAGLCHWLGLLNAPPATVSTPINELRPDDLGSWEYHPILGEMVLEPVPALAKASRIVGNYLRAADGDYLADSELRLACQCLKICSFYEREFTIRTRQDQNTAAQAAMEYLEKGRGSEFDGGVLDLFMAHLGFDEEALIG